MKSLNIKRHQNRMICPSIPFTKVKSIGATINTHKRFSVFHMQDLKKKGLIFNSLKVFYGFGWEIKLGSHNAA